MDYAEIKDLIKDFNASTLAKLEIELNGAKVKMEKQSESTPAPTPAHIPAQVPAIYDGTPGAARTAAWQGGVSPDEAAASGSSGNSVTAPIVGTFYRGSSPEKPPFVKAGDSVKPGDVLCVIEAMKIMNEITCEHAGKVAEICAADGAMVEFGQVLFRIVPE